MGKLAWVSGVGVAVTASVYCAALNAADPDDLKQKVAQAFQGSNERACTLDGSIFLPIGPVPKASTTCYEFNGATAADDARQFCNDIASVEQQNDKKERTVSYSAACPSSAIQATCELPANDLGVKMKVTFIKVGAEPLAKAAKGCAKRKGEWVNAKN